MARVLLALLLLLPAAVARAQAVDIVEYGTYVTAGDSPSPDSPPDAVIELRAVRDPRFLDRTTTIPGQLCQRFGIRFVLRPEGIPRSPLALVPVTIHITHPRVTGPDGRWSDSESWPQMLVPGQPSMAGFDFDQPWEIASGRWTISVERDGTVLASQAFDVVDVPGGGGGGDGCQHLS